MVPVRTLSVLILLAGIAGCAAPRDAAAYGPAARPSALSYEATVDSLEAATSSSERLAVTARALARAGLTPVALPLLSTPESRFTLPTPTGRLAVGLIPGRSPILRPELVVVGIDVDSPHVAAVLEAARTLVERSNWISVPDRSVQVVLWSSPSSRRRALAGSLWASDAIWAVLEVGDEPSTQQDGLELVGGASGLDLSALVLARVLEVAREPTPVDSLSL